MKCANPQINSWLWMMESRAEILDKQQRPVRIVNAAGSWMGPESHAGESQGLQTVQSIYLARDLTRAGLRSTSSELIANCPLAGLRFAVADRRSEGPLPGCA